MVIGMVGDLVWYLEGSVRVCVEDSEDTDTRSSGYKWTGREISPSACGAGVRLEEYHGESEVGTKIQLYTGGHHF